MQIQSQKGKDPLRWDKSGVVVESLGNQQYTVKMDGSGRVTLRNRRFLRKIEPLVPRYTSLDDILDKIPVVDDKEVLVNKPSDEGQVHERVVQGGGDEGQRRSVRASRPPDRYESKW